jgi:hypothetical protein
LDVRMVRMSAALSPEAPLRDWRMPSQATAS